jgi:CheY-like chemotaxis protein
MDLQIEPLDGIGSTRQIRSRDSEVEVVALTSFGNPGKSSHCKHAGVTSHQRLHSRRDPYLCQPLRSLTLSHTDISLRMTADMSCARRGHREARRH